MRGVGEKRREEGGRVWTWGSGRVSPGRGGHISVHS